MFYVCESMYVYPVHMYHVHVYSLVGTSPTVSLVYSGDKECCSLLGVSPNHHLQEVRISMTGHLDPLEPLDVGDVVMFSDLSQFSFPYTFTSLFNSPFLQLKVLKVSYIFNFQRKTRQFRFRFSISFTLL